MQRSGPLRLRGHWGLCERHDNPNTALAIEEILSVRRLLASNFLLAVATLISLASSRCTSLLSDDGEPRDIASQFKEVIMRISHGSSVLAVLAVCGAACSLAHAQPWQNVGPGPAEFGQVENLLNQNNEVAGAVRGLAPHPTNPDVLYVGSINGGVWKTVNATDLFPDWAPLTDTLPSLSCGALRTDPADASGNTVVLGIGRFSSFSSTGGAQTGVYRTIDGGANWTQIGVSNLPNKNIAAIAVRGSVILAAASSATTGSAGLYRSTNSGTSFTLLSGAGGTGLPAGGCVDVFADPLVTTRYYAAVVGNSSVGVYRSENSGATWTATAALPLFSGSSTNNMRLAIHATATNNVVYVTLTNSSRLAEVYRSTNQGGSWTALGVPVTNEGSSNFGVNVGGQGTIHTSVAADPVNPNLVYVGGDRQPGGNNDGGVFPNSIGANDYSGRIFKGDASLSPASRWNPLTHIGTASNSAPHADSRYMAFDSAGTLHEVSDGGVFRRLNASSTSGDWQSVNGDLSVTETHTADWDSVNKIAICGTQDNGTSAQDFAGDDLWTNIFGGDGGKVAVDDSFRDDLVYYFGSFQFLQAFFRATVDGNNVNVGFEFPSLFDNDAGLTITQIDSAQFYTPVEIHKTEPRRMFFLMNTFVFESQDRGESVKNLGSVSGTPTAAVGGGFSGGIENQELLWVGSTGGLARRLTLAGSLTSLGNPTGQTIRDIAIDPKDSNRVVVISSNTIFRTTNGNAPVPTWTNITGSLGTDGALRAVEIIPSNVPDQVRIVVGGNNGVFVSTMASPSAWTELDTSLANAPIRELRYDDRDGILCAGTLGRGVWLFNTRPCPADFNGDGFLDFTDFDDFVTAFEGGSPSSDFNGDGFLDFTDFDDFVAAFEGGCGSPIPPPARRRGAHRDWKQPVDFKMPPKIQLLKRDPSRE